MVDLRRAAAIVGAYEHPSRYAPDKSETLLHAESAIGALEDAGLSKGDIDAYFTCGTGRLPPIVMADYLNLAPRYMDSTDIGGASFLSHLGHAAAGIQSGLFNCALISYGSTSRSRGVAVGTAGFSRHGWATVPPVPESFEEIYGLTTVGLYALVARRHMHEYGTTSEQLARIAVSTRKHAVTNPHAVMRDPIAVEDVLGSRMISDPLHMLDCCLVTDGGGAVIVASPEVARASRQRPAWLLGFGEGVGHMGAGLRDLTVSAAARSGPRAMSMAGVTPRDIDMAMIYDSFTITVLVTLEDLGFCKKGEGGEFVSGGRIEIGGELPINTDGGGLSSNHPGRRGIFLLVEATKQLRHERGEMQVPGCQVAVCHGTGGTLGHRHSGVTVVLGRD